MHCWLLASKPHQKDIKAYQGEQTWIFSSDNLTHTNSHYFLLGQRLNAFLVAPFFPSKFNVVKLLWINKYFFTQVVWKVKCTEWAVNERKSCSVRVCVCVQRKALMVWTGQWKNIFRKGRMLWAGFLREGNRRLWGRRRTWAPGFRRSRRSPGV